MTDGVATAAAAKPVVTGLRRRLHDLAEAKAAGKDGGYRGWQLVHGRPGRGARRRRHRGGHAALGFLHPDLVRAGLGGRPRRRAARRHGRPVRRGVPRLGPAPVRRAGRGRPARRPAERCRGAADAGGLAAVRRPGGPAAAGRRARAGRSSCCTCCASTVAVRTSARVRSRRAAPAGGDLAGAGGPGNAAFFGWPEPLPEAPTSCGPGWPRPRRPPTPRSRPAYARAGPNAERDDLLRLLGAPLPRRGPGGGRPRPAALTQATRPPGSVPPWRHDDFCLRRR